MLWTTVKISLLHCRQELIPSLIEPQDDEIVLCGNVRGKMESTVASEQSRRTALLQEKK